MSRILGLDLGTNSIGWAVVEENNGVFELKEKGVRIFQEGVKIEKGVESSKAAERTGFRSARRLKFRRKLRKIETLKVLSEYGFCPELTEMELNDWRYKKVYPENEAFRKWWLTDNQDDPQERTEQRKNPYYFRHLAVTQKLDLSHPRNRYKLGRAFYHMAQRRGFLSNRLEGESDGVVTKGINEISEAKGERTLGQYFYEDLYLPGKKIRNHYTHREEHYLEEFYRICEFQGIDDEIKEKLYKAIFYQRPLKSQKGLIGKCVFEKNKHRCAVSRPEFEEYRMLCFINNIRIKTPHDEKLRVLSSAERLKVLPLFFRKSKDHFDFEDIANALAPKKRYKFYKDREKKAEDFLFNYSMKTTVSGCPVSARFKDVFGEEFINDNYQLILDNNGQINARCSDAWHALFTFDSETKLKEFAVNKLHLPEDQVTDFFKTKVKQDYAALSLKAIKKILPHLREGLIYSHAVFLANLPTVLKECSGDYNLKEISSEIGALIASHNRHNQIIEVINELISTARTENIFSLSTTEIEKKFRSLALDKIKAVVGARKWNGKSEEQRQLFFEHVFEDFCTQMNDNRKFKQKLTIVDAVKNYLNENFGCNDKDLNKLYHPAAIETYKLAQRSSADDKLYLGSPMVSAVRNPMAMRALHQLRKVINELIKKDIITPDTVINIEMARGLLNANERIGLKRWQDNREKTRKEYAKLIQEYFHENGISAVASDDEILKYQLWIEQNEHCLYTGKQIALSDFLGANPKFDIEHTIPRSLSFDNSQANKTLCCAKFNRDVKKKYIPAELANHEDILVRIEPWLNKIDDLNKQIDKCVRASKSAADKPQKDNAIQKRHQLTYERNYWQDKCRRFMMDEVPEGFKNSQKVDIGIITKYSRLYLQTLFKRVYTVKGSIVADFRKMWGLQDHFSKKERINHVHHCIDAITMACITKANYETLAQFYHEWEDLYQAKVDAKPKVKKPWDTFVEDVKRVEEELLVSHYTPDNLPKKAKKKLRKRGVIQRNEKGEVIYQKGDSVRGSLHKDTFYGAIERTIVKTNGDEQKAIKYVVRKSVADLDDSSLKNIVDDRVRTIVTNARIHEKELNKEIGELSKKLKKANAVEEALIEKQISELKLKITQLYAMPNKNGAPIPIKKVRVFQPTVTNPLHIKSQRDQKRNGKRKAYKESYHVANDGNYLMAIYEGVDKKGKIKRTFALVNNLTAGQFFSNKLNYELIPKLKDGLNLKGVLKTGDLVLFYQQNPSEIFTLPSYLLRQRLYKVLKMSKDGRVTFKFHQVAANDELLKDSYEIVNGMKAPKSLTNGESKVNFTNPCPKLLLTPGNFDFLINGQDFRLTVLGEIERI